MRHWRAVKGFKKNKKILTCRYAMMYFCFGEMYPPMYMYIHLLPKIRVNFYAKGV